MNKIVFGIYVILTMPVILADFLSPKTGKEYNVGFFKKLVIVFKMIRANIGIKSASNFIEHLTMAAKILNTPKTIEGCIVECGTFKGVSAGNLSLIAHLCDRKLEIFDSFAGLPEPEEYDKTHDNEDLQLTYTYKKGDYTGTIDEVKNNIKKYGKIGVCNFNKGYFNETLPKFDKKTAFIFLDVDLIDSLKICLQNLWPLLNKNCYLFTHEASNHVIASVFYDKQWWHETLNIKPPGLVGAGSGLGLVPGKGRFYSGLGYAVKKQK
jgi:hypothetical protein